MKVYRSPEEARGKFGPGALAIGNFDGVHIGHQVLLDKVCAYASYRRVFPSALTFYPHPSSIVAPERIPPLLTSLEDRLRLLASCGAERVFVLPFTNEVSRMSPEEFVSQVIVDTLGTRAVVVGENFHFGAKQSGTPATLRALGEKFGFESQFLPPVSYRGELVSSSAIRRHIVDGHISRANRLLGRCFFVQGSVVSGHGVGSKQTVPTLNLLPIPGQVVPRGVYVTETVDLEGGRRWPSITNVGIRPTFKGDDVTIETYLLSPLEGSAPKQIQVQFRRFVRWEQEFPDPSALKSQILKDVARAKTFWRRASRLASPAASIY